jgi:bilirubin oxidase
MAITEITRRRFLQRGAGATAGLLLIRYGGAAAAAPRGGTLDSASIPKYRAPLVIPPVMPQTGTVVTSKGRSADYYEIAVRQFQQQVLPPGMAATTVWGYGSVNHPGSFNYPAFTIEASWRTPVRVKWINELKDPVTGDFLPHLLPVDPTLHWANPPGGRSGRDGHPHFSRTPGPYRGPVPIVTHLHGHENTAQESDGFAESWFLPDARNIPSGFARTGTHYDIFKRSSPLGSGWTPGSAVFEYQNDQRATTLWFHDHTLGMTRLNVYAGPAGFYLLRGGTADQVNGVLPGPAPAPGDSAKTRYYEIPIAIQDRSFNADGSLFYPASRAFFDKFTGPYVPRSDIAPIFNPEVFGNAMVVNGRTWPFLEVEPRRYRLRLLNGCNARFLILKLSNGMPFWQIGVEGGFLQAPVQRRQLLLAPAERADVIVDFTGVSPGTEILLLNVGPDEPFSGGLPGKDFKPADPNTTGQVMQLRVIGATGSDSSTPPSQLGLPPIISLPAATRTRRLSLNELDSAVLRRVGPREAELGTVGADRRGKPISWDHPVTENPAVGATEVWELHNFTPDAHPIHVHEVQFQVLDRRPMAGGRARRRPAWEAGFKDTVIAYPGQITRLKIRFARAGLFVWHCHIVEHEDNEMMRPYRIG